MAKVEKDLEKVLETFLERERKGFKTFVYKVSGEVVGTTSLFIEDKYTHDFGCVGHIEDVVVMEEYRLQGIGSALVTHAINKAREAGCYKVILDRGEEVAGFYTRFGFEPHETGMRLDF